MKPYKEKVSEIMNMQWDLYHPFNIVMISLASAKEFATSLRCALNVYPDDHNLKLMAEGELKTDNLRYRGYDKNGDHWEFLNHFANRSPTHASLFIRHSSHAVEEYLEVVTSMTDEERAMSIFSREQELPDIFRKIVDSHNWEQFGLGFYRYYLEEHIRIDSEDGGHAELTKEYNLDPEVLDRFYTARLKLYKDGLMPVNG